MTAPSYRLRSFLILAANIAACFAAVGLLAFSPSPDGRYAILAPSGASAPSIVAAAGADLVTASAEGRVAVAWSGDPRLRARLAAAGALLVFNPALALGCASRDLP